MPQTIRQASTTTPDDNYSATFRSRGRVHPNHTVIYHQGDKVDGFYRVNSGVVMVFRLLEDSQRQISGFYTEGDFFGLSADEHYHDTATTVATSNIVCLTMADVRQSLELQQELFAITCGQLESAQTLITTLTKKTASEKVATFLLMLADRQKRSGEEFDIRLPMSRLDIADYLGLSIETVSRRLTALKAQGVITLPDRNTARVCQFSKLSEMAGAQ
ncbi:helix-turn-helix domain-containing protein [Fretibacter rubidus]|uniref:helix-turn-helix domain-containing protein n=1 Tax=Fretibacter rubidus TaxID=570162 RepID=UPI00352B25B4